MARASEYEDRKLEVLQSIFDRVRTHSRTPTVRELADSFDVSPATMHSWLTRLSEEGEDGEEGLVAWTAGRHRSLHCTQRGIQLLASRGEQSA